MSPSDWVSEAEAWATANGLDGRTALGYGLGGRSGPLRKFQTLWKWDWHGQWLPFIQVKGFSQRNRIVYMANAGVNTAVFPLYARLKSAQMAIAGMWRDGSDELRLAGHPYRYEADVSGFDTSISHAMFDIVAEELIRGFPALANSIRQWRFAETLPLLTPPLDPTMGHGVGIREMSGGLRSGLLLTSVMGSLIQRSLVRMALHAQRRTLDEVVACIHGDDVALACDKPLNVDEWVGAYESMGMKCALVPGLSFLSRHITKDGTSLPIGGRIIQQTCSNENEPTGGGWVVGLLALGFLARTQGAEGLPADIQSAVIQSISAAEWIHPFATDDLAHTRDAVRMGTAQLVDAALRRKAGLAWILQQLRSAEHSYLGRSLAKSFPGLILGLTSTDDVIFRLCQTVNSLSRRDRMRLATRGMNAISNSETASLGWLTEVQHETNING
jgi:hypothetical protein